MTAKYNFVGSTGTTVDFVVTSKLDQATTVIDVKSEACAHPSGKIFPLFASVKQLSREAKIY